MHRIGGRGRLLLAGLLAGTLAACAPGGTRDEVAEAPAVAPEATADADLAAALMAGEFAWQDGRGESAARHFARAAQLTEDPEIIEHAVRVALVSKQWDLARAGLERWRSVAPEAEGIARAETALALFSGDAERAADRLAAALEEGEGGRKHVAQVLLVSPEPELSVAMLERLSTRPVLPGGIDSWVLLSQVAAQLDRDVLAAALIDKGIARHAADAAGYAWRGHLALQAKQYDAARADFERALERDPDDRGARLTLAAVLSESGDHAAAARALEPLGADEEALGARAAYAARAEDQALMADAYTALEALPEPRSDARLELLGQMAELLERRDDALRWYRAVPKGDRHTAAQLRVAVLLDDTGRHEEALAHLQSLRAQGIEDDARLGETFLLEAELLARRELEQRALDAYGRGLAVLPEDRRLLYARALKYEQLDRIAEAEADLRRVVALDPEDPDALNALGYTLTDRTDRHTEALALIEKALKLKPDEPAIIDSMGWVQYRLGNLEEARKHLERAYGLQPDAEIAAHLGEVLWMLGEREEARRIWAEGEAKDAKNETLRETLKRLTE